jgi:hypothetical protein
MEHTSGHQLGHVEEYSAYVGGEANGTGTPTLVWFFVKRSLRIMKLIEFVGIGVQANSEEVVVSINTTFTWLSKVRNEYSTLALD